MSDLQIKRLTLRRRGRTIVEDATFTIRPGEILGLIGPNGSGKSTLLKAVAGIASDAEGQALLDGTDLMDLPTRDRATLITYVSAELDSEFPVTALEAVSLGDFVRSDSRESTLRAVMEETGCWVYRDRVLSELSGGELQRVAVARAFYQDSKIVLFDESFSKLDLHHQARMGEILKKRASRGTAFVLVSHDLNYTTDWAERCVLLRAGKVLAEGSTRDVITEANLRLLYPDANIVLTPHPVTGAMKVYFRG